jgi:hypothetical protein
MTIAYVAQTRDHLLMLDEEGVCLHVHRRNHDLGGGASEGALACLGAQYVAALDPSEPGLLAHEPTLGVPMLFAKVGPSGKISVVRTGPLERFDAQAFDDGDRTTEPRLHDTQRRPPSIHYLPRARFDDEEEATLQFYQGVPTRRSAPPPPPPILRSVSTIRGTGRARVA